MKFPVFDLHCDTALSLLGRDFSGKGSLLRNSGHVDLERAKVLPGYTQCFACYTSTWDWLPEGLTVEEVFQREKDVILREVECNSDVIRMAYSAGDVQENLEQGKMSAVLTIEGPAGFGFDPAKLEELHRAGFRMSSLGWNERNPLTGSHITGGGLTDLGREYVEEAQRLGMIVDVSHISDEGFWGILDVTQAPIVASHSNSRSVCGHSRNLTDDMFKALCQTGGVAGFNQCAPFVGDQPTMDSVCDHIFHFLDLDPSGDHIALGGDLDGCDKMPEGFDGVQSYPAMARRLLERGLDEATLHKIFWRNAFGVMQRCCM